jgi:hypothetical protein
MSRRDRLLFALAALGAIVFVCLLVRILLLRYERGDVFPAYSTLRADPLGTRVFYEALQATPGYEVNRGFTTLHREMENAPKSLFYLGMDNEELATFTPDEIKALDQFVRQGGRVVISFTPESPAELEKGKTGAHSGASSGQEPAPGTEPQTQQEKYEREQIKRDAEARKNEKDAPPEKDNLEPPEYHRSIAAQWGFGTERQKEKNAGKSGDDDDDAQEKPEIFAQRAFPGATEMEVAWKSALYFVRLETEWEVLYRVRNKPVIVRRHLGQGDILLASDSYFLSNEALRDDRCARLLGLMAGPPGPLLFDETHLGTQDQEGVVHLAEKFHLQGFVLGMLVVTALCLWRNSVPLVPPAPAEATALLGGAVSGKDSRSGLVNLLHRNIPASELLGVCLATWKRSLTPNRPGLGRRAAEMESVVTGAVPGQMVAVYQDLCALNSPGKAKGTHASKP